MDDLSEGLGTRIQQLQSALDGLRDREAILRLIYDNSSVAIFTLTADARVDHANERMSKMFATPMEHLIGREYVDLVHPSEREISRKNISAHLTSSIAKVHLQRSYCRGDGTIFWGELTSQRMLDRNDQVRLVCVVADISERKAAEQALAQRTRELEALNLQLNNTVAELAASNAELLAAREKLERLAQHDTLTGTWNRRKIEESARHEMLRKERYEHPVSMIFVDLDHFKQINDTRGHAVGDKVLKGFCDVASNCIRSTDLLGRWGGEEFVILTPHTELAIASVLAERIRKATADQTFSLGCRVTASFGVAECRTDETWNSWLSRSDAALYTAKDAGRNHVVADWEHQGESVRAELVDPSFIRLVWHPAYESGHAKLDLQHRGLFSHANGLLTAVIGGRPTDEVMPQIESLLGDLIEHFRDEEAVLRSVDYSLTDEHVECHKALIARARELAEDLLSGTLPLGELLNFLAYDVVAKHMLSEDRKFFGQLQPFPNRTAPY